MHEVITAEADMVSRTEVRAPVRGTVKQLFVNTVGGVIQPGADLIEIVPLEDNLLVEAKVRPADIAFLRPGQPAMVKVTAYDFAIYGGLDAVVEDISADTITDDKGESFYRVRVRTHDNALRQGRRAAADHPRHDHAGRHPDRREDGARLPAEADPARQGTGAARALAWPAAPVAGSSPARAEQRRFERPWRLERLPTPGGGPPGPQPVSAPQAPRPSPSRSVRQPQVRGRHSPGSGSTRATRGRDLPGGPGPPSAGGLAELTPPA